MNRANLARASHRLLVALTALAFAAVASPAAAREAEERETTDALLGMASDAYGRLLFEEALIHLERAADNSGNSRTQLTRIFLLRGVCYASLGKRVEAQRAFARLLALDPSFRLDRNVSPRVREPLEDVLHLGAPRMEVELLPPLQLSPDGSLTFSVEVRKDDVELVKAVELWYRHGGQGTLAVERTEVAGQGSYVIRVPPPAEPAQGTTWYARLLGAKDSELRLYGSASHPYQLEVKPLTGPSLAQDTPWYDQWWVWAAAGAAVVLGAATVVAVVVLSTPQGATAHDVPIVVHPYGGG